MEVLTLTGGRGANHILETQDLQSANAVRYGGNIHVIDLISGEVNVDSNRLPIVVLLGTGTILRTNLIGRRAKPVINKVFDSEDARAAYDYQATQQHADRVFIEVSKD
ncbi:hypothetical protein BD309DRAFT_1023516 [Dichomitus squalens]|uniref:Uncharacterized protein n=1 Tax=Dichomitus squalens TaxID=114155 RepID=A0A4Q9N9R0_9APHY|nr:hypothetical protein BD311DRAFT_805031 [Dichomitus squalens]TBU37554.1 hypothetical protein BD309DRAFT_1023516 [Dichomitus squalens]